MDVAYTEPLDVGQGTGTTNLKKKHNSCWTFSISTAKPSMETTLKCLSKFYAKQMAKNSKRKMDAKDDVFLDKSLPLDDSFSGTELPDHDDIYELLQPLFVGTGLTSENAIILMVYIDRMLERTGVFMTKYNWKRIMLGGLLMASKVWDDLAIWNVDFCSILPNTEIEDINALERFYLIALQFNVSVKASAFAAKYFDLREFARKSNATFDLQPLSDDDAMELEVRTDLFSKAVTDKFGDLSDRTTTLATSLRKTKSENMFVSKPTSPGIM